MPRVSFSRTWSKLRDDPTANTVCCKAARHLPTQCSMSRHSTHCELMVHATSTPGPRPYTWHTAWGAHVSKLASSHNSTTVSNAAPLHAVLLTDVCAVCRCNSAAATHARGPPRRRHPLTMLQNTHVVLCCNVLNYVATEALVIQRHPMTASIGLPINSMSIAPGLQPTCVLGR